MTGMTLSEFHDKLYYGADIDLCYRSAYYHITSGCDGEGYHSITTYHYDCPPDKQPSYYREIGSISHRSPAENINRYFDSQIFDGKSLRQIESEIRVIYS